MAAAHTAPIDGAVNFDNPQTRDEYALERVFLAHTFAARFQRRDQTASCGPLSLSSYGRQ
jgi:hypothetical protein